MLMTTIASIALVISQFNPIITQGLYEGAQRACQVFRLHYQSYPVPGAAEIPWMAQHIIRHATESYQAIVALGCVIQGDTDHYQYICSQVSQGCQRVSLDHHVPVLFGVLTAQTEALAYTRSQMPFNKGYEVVTAAKMLIDTMRSV